MVLLFLIPFLWSSQNFYNLGGDDSRLYFYTPSNWLKNVALYSWFGHFFGSYIPPQAHIPCNIFSIVLKFLCPLLNLQKMIYGLILFFAFLMTFLTIKEFLDTEDRTSYYAAILGGLTYVFSPLVFYTNWTFLVASIDGIVGYPLIFFFFLRAINRKQVRYLIYGSLFSVIFSIGLRTTPLASAFLMGLFIFFILYLSFFSERLKIIIKYTGIYLLLLFFINSFWTIPWFSSMKQGTLQVVFALSVLGKETAVSHVSTIAPYMNIFDTLCNLLSRGMIYNWNGAHIKIAKYTYGLTPLSIFLPIIIFSALLFRKNKKTARLNKIWFSLAITTLFLAYLVTVNITKIGIPLFNLFTRYFPGWVMFRNFYGKFAPTYVFFYSLTLGVSLYIISKSTFKKSVKIAVFVIIFLIVILQALPFIRGDINNLFLRPNIDATMNVAIPPYYIDAISTISELEEGKVLSLPLTVASWSFFKSRGNNGIYIGLSPIFVFTGRDDFNGRSAFIDGERFIPGLTSLVKEAMQNRDYEFLGKLFGLLNLRYIVYNSEIYENEIPGKIGEYYIWGYNEFQTKDNIESLIKEISEKRIGKFNPISIYELSSKYYYPTIYSTNKALPVNTETLVPLSETKYLGGKPMILFSEQMKEMAGPN